MIEDDVFIAPNATFTNDPYPRSKQHRQEYPRTIIKRNASIGANATILPGLTVGEHAMIGAGAVLTHDAPPYAILTGNPARIHGYADVSAERPFQPEATQPHRTHTAEVGGCELHRLPLIRRSSGHAFVWGVSATHSISHQTVLPGIRCFQPAHSWRACPQKLHQFLVCVHGRCNVVVDDGTHRQEFILDSPAVGIYIPPMVWAVQYRYSPDAVLLVLASDYYEPQDYIRDYPTFLALCHEFQAAPSM